MAEGAEETESNNNAEIPAMLGTVLPCEALQASIGGIKREFDSIGIRTSPSQSPSLHQILTAAATITTAATTPSSTISTAATLRSSTTKSPSPSPSSSSSSSSLSGNVQQHPINLKSEEYEKESCHRIRSPSPSALYSELEKESKISSEYYKRLGSSSAERTSQSPHDQANAAAVAAAVAAQAHLNGTMQDMINLQKLQNLASIQQQQQQQQQHQQPQQQQQQQQREQQQQHSSVGPGALAGLQGLAGISSAATLNSPLNLSVGSTSTLSSTSTKPSPTLTPTPVCSALGSNGGGISACSIPGGSQMPQLILASGQLVQGVQGAQLLIPTSQGIAVQTILTIPVSQQISTNDQFLQSYAALTAGAASPFATAAALSAHQMPLVQQPSNFYKPNLFSNGVQQLLAALHPQLFPMTHSETMHQPPLHHAPDPSKQLPVGHSHNMHLIHGQQQSNHQQHPLERNSPKVESLSHNREPSPQNLMRKSPISGLHSGHSPPRNSNFTAIHLPPHPSQGQEKPSTTSSSSPSTNHFSTASSSASSSSALSLSGSHLQHSHSPNSHNSHNISSSSHSLSSRVNSPSSAASVLNSINRLTTSNGELTITKSHAPASHSSSSLVAATATASSTSPSPGPPVVTHHSSSSHQQSQQQQHPQSSTQQQQHQSQPSAMKLSPCSMHLSPTGTEASTTDLLVDSPNEPTINQTNCNVVDGIDLDEIKEFAKAFKLRRLSLGLTQTQVGQALSVTEGPAYSQSAICSALAAQMYAAQLSTQQQNMFEKLDITPKSAQKIKPVLERWMKEAEESHWNRYKTGQNHLTDFIGIEPSKKRKRRTSFTPQALELLNAHFERNTHPSGTEITGLAHQLGYEREVIRIWFCNKRQALKNTVRMMSKGMV